MTTSFSLRTLSRDDILHHLPALSEILASCVNGGASVSFMLPFAPQTAITFLVTHCRQRGGRGSALCWPPSTRRNVPSAPCNLSPVNRKTSPIERMSPNYWFTKNVRRQGIAQALMSELERIARRERKTVLVLDTATGSGAEQFYACCGWEKVGQIPRLALMPDGE